LFATFKLVSYIMWSKIRLNKGVGVLNLWTKWSQKILECPMLHFMGVVWHLWNVFYFPLDMVVNHIMSFLIHKWGPGEFEDDEMLFELGFLCKKTLPCFQILRPSSCFNLKNCLFLKVQGYDVCYMLVVVGLKVCLGLYILKGVGQFEIKGMYM
jgi:hypothetical protein